jgi:hypothetical protein
MSCPWSGSRIARSASRTVRSVGAVGVAMFCAQYTCPPRAAPPRHRPRRALRPGGASWTPCRWNSQAAKHRPCTWTGPAAAPRRLGRTRSRTPADPSRWAGHTPSTWRRRRDLPTCDRAGGRGSFRSVSRSGPARAGGIRRGWPAPRRGLSHGGSSQMPGGETPVASTGRPMEGEPRLARRPAAGIRGPRRPSSKPPGNLKNPAGIATTVRCSGPTTSAVR